MSTAAFLLIEVVRGKLVAGLRDLLVDAPVVFLVGHFEAALGDG